MVEQSETVEGEQVDPDRFAAKLTAITREGVKIGLQVNDLLIGVNGVPFAYAKDELQQKLTYLTRGKTALTFRRDNRDFTVVATVPNVGNWDPVTAPIDVEKKRISATFLTNWEVFRSDDGLFDMQPLAPSLLALVAAPIWLAQMRLWVPFAMILSIVLITLPFGQLMSMAVYGLASVYVWRMSQEMFRTDRISKGLEPHLIFAAASERVAHRVYARLYPDDVFLYAPGAAGKLEDTIEKMGVE